MAKSTGFGPKKAYLILYNAASAVAWATILGRVAVVLGWKGAPFVPLVVDNFARITQTFAIMEVVHALTGVVPAPVFTTAMQVASRLFLMWAVCFPFPQLNVNIFYSTMLCAWSLTEVMRYSYFALKQINAVPAWLHWLRYSAFLVLYPVGISSEVAMTLAAMWGPAADLASWYPMALTAVLAAYGPGSAILYAHMLKQRRRYLGTGKPAQKKKQ
ncbi:tyrosine phosphatase-like protein [Chaetomium fimeti]|jgi:very-long-chain (3R)-3-hydroxyacyl-CoA dehydratase|uniref:Very-long-chain (3R)-3-hydroxyacyl-CoA dehydratase n=1 Tax=Chaetomium fimeti TaxID=1854472 RepID=A0AAE0LSN1_9PEZI|nr:tyrosine phosphatase-like protein [Chaetomium fimeti]